MNESYKGIAKIQHYVPQFLLKNFGEGKKRHLNVFDKKNGRTFKTNAKNIAGESHFYDFKIKEEALTVEPILSAIESFAKPLLARLINTNSIKSLSDDDKSIIADFLSIQFTRTNWYRKNMSFLHNSLFDKVKAMSDSIEANQGIKTTLPFLDEEQQKMLMINMMLEAPRKYSPFFIDKIWTLIKTDPNNLFIIGDNPTALYNIYDYGVYGNLGLAVRGIQIYLPLTPELALCLWCPSYNEEFRKAIQGPKASLISNSVLTETEKIIEAFESGKPLSYNPDNVVFFNSLQILHSERYVFSFSNDFSLVKKMISEHPQMQQGPRPKFN